VTAAKLLDLLIIGAALISAWLWYLASGGRLRRVKATETLDGQDLNRIVVAVNRAQLLSRRAALATMIAAILVALRAAVDAVTR
jgi:hypothetical protein